MATDNISKSICRYNFVVNVDFMAVVDNPYVSYGMMDALQLIHFTCCDVSDDISNIINLVVMGISRFVVKT